MARPLRIEYDGALYHVTSRGNEQRPIFKDDTDRNFFLGTLAHVNQRFHWLCHAYCLMGNHYHLVIETKLQGRGQVLQCEKRFDTSRLWLVLFAWSLPAHRERRVRSLILTIRGRFGRAASD